MKPNIRQVHKFLSTVYEYLFCFQTQAFLQTSHPYIVEEMSITYETRIKKTPENGRLKKFPEKMSLENGSRGKKVSDKWSSENFWTNLSGIFD